MPCAGWSNGIPACAAVLMYTCRQVGAVWLHVDLQPVAEQAVARNTS